MPLKFICTRKFKAFAKFWLAEAFPNQYLFIRWTFLFSNDRRKGCCFGVVRLSGVSPHLFLSSLFRSITSTFTNEFQRNFAVILHYEQMSNLEKKKKKMFR